MTVHLVGAGPGDPGLLTVRALDVLRRADVVVYDRLSQESLLDLAPPGAERIDVGKAPGHVRMSQDDINDLLVERGRTGARVVRLKGGDPFVFARGGEEAAALAAVGVPFEVVPGITSAIAAPAYAGIPVTLRHSSTSVTIVTGHEEPGAGDDGTVDWGAVARVGGTIVVLMGVARIGRIADALMAGGRSPETPVAAVQWGTRPEQRTVRATLATIGAADLGTPSTIVVGDVAACDLAWFENRPLFGRRVVVTRARQQASALIARLAALGAATVEVPAIAITDPADGAAALSAAVERLAAGAYAWLVVTSPNGAQRLLAALAAAGRDARALGGVGLAAIGPGTAEVLAQAHLVPDLVPERFVAESLLDAFPDAGPDGGGVLLARAAVARDVLPDGLVAKGWSVDVVEAYRTEAVPLDDAARAALADAEIVTFTSSSTVTNFLAAAGPEAVPPVVAAIGPVTAATARDHGLTVDVEAQVHTIDGLVDALCAWVADHPAGVIPAGAAPDALIFDFDGLILDTETCTYEAVVEIFAEHGESLDEAWWHSILGTADHPHWTEQLAAQLGRPVDRAALVARHEARRLPVIEGLAACDGVADLLDAADADGVPAAVASSSASEWVVPHLERLGLRHRFGAVVTRDDVGGDSSRTKPAPDLFLLAAEALGAPPVGCVVLEDSPNGVAAGRAAGMAVVAVPGPMTRTLDFGAAHLVAGSLADLDIATLGRLVPAV